MDNVSKFKMIYERLDSFCQRKLNCLSCGVESYASYLLCFGDKDSEGVAKKLLGYSEAIKEQPSSQNISICKADVAWLQSLYKKLNAKKDPLTKYLS